MRLTEPLHSAVSNSAMPSFDASLKRSMLYISDLQTSVEGGEGRVISSIHSPSMNGTVRTAE